jgi:transposase InsO family protein
MLQELSVVEQRYLAVREVLEGATVTDVATRYGVDRRTVYRWLVRYANEGLGALADRSSRPDRCPHQIPPEIESRIVALRKAHPGWGPRTILSKLRRELEEPPSRSSIYRCLLRHRLIDHKPRRRRSKDYRRWERSRPMELWQMDVMGEVLLQDGTELKAITGIDDHSRYCVSAKVVHRATARPVCDALLEAFARHGVPEQILTDNGKVLHRPARPQTRRGGLRPDLPGQRVRHILTAPYSPTTTGKIERLHKTIRKELLSERTFTTIEQAQAELDAWVARYNSEREHQAIGDVPPVRRFELVQRDPVEVIDPQIEAEDEPRPAGHTVSRRVDRAGRISILKHRYHVGRHLVGRRVQVESVDGLLHVTHDGVLVATHARRHLPEDDARMDRRATASRPSRPTAGHEVLRKVDTWGSVSFAGTGYRVGNRYAGQIVGVRVVDDTVQITQDGMLVRTHKARHDKAKEFGALGNPGGRPRRSAEHVA